jgi:hypothetical protein
MNSQAVQRDVLLQRWEAKHAEDTARHTTWTTPERVWVHFNPSGCGGYDCRRTRDWTIKTPTQKTSAAEGSGTAFVPHWRTFEMAG